MLNKAILLTTKKDSFVPIAEFKITVGEVITNGVLVSKGYSSVVTPVVGSCEKIWGITGVDLEALVDSVSDNSTMLIYFINTNRLTVYNVTTGAKVVLKPLVDGGYVYTGNNYAGIFSGIAVGQSCVIQICM